MVDRVIEARGDESGIGIKNVSINEPQFQGHFPERPVMPGVLLIEGMAQAAGVLCVNAHRPGKKPPLVYFMSRRQGRISHDEDQSAPQYVLVQGPRPGLSKFAR
jgi:3-hydroxymyristoyl/3-hydroxydecanoyl-(acyl carrier protein) dehydratase